MRAIAAVLVGYAAWAALWLGGNGLLFADVSEAVAGGEAFTDAGPLAAILCLSVGCSLVGGLVAKLIARRPIPVLILALALLGTGIPVQASAWELLPQWYHLTFLALLVPATLVGGRLVPTKKER